MDSISESAIQESPERLMAGCTRIVIAHRLTTILKADRELYETRFRKVPDMESERTQPA